MPTCTTNGCGSAEDNSGDSDDSGDSGDVIDNSAGDAGSDGAMESFAVSAMASTFVAAASLF